MYIAKINILPDIRIQYGTKINDNIYYLLTEGEKKFYHHLVEDESLEYFKDEENKI